MKNPLRIENMIRNYFLTLSIVLCLCMTSNVTYAQDLTITCTQLNHKSYGDELERQFSSYSLFRTDFKNAYKKLKRSDQLEIALNIEGLIKSRISLTERNLLSSDYKAYELGEDGLIEKELSIIKNYKGNIIGDPTSDIRMSLDGNMLYGYIKKGKETIWIEPAKSFDESLPKNTMVVYYEKDVIIGKVSRCASSKVHKQKTKTDKQVKSAGSCRLTRMSIAMDYSYITDADHNSYSSAVNQTLHIMNLVEGNYGGSAFSSDIEFEIVEHFAPSSSSQSNTIFGSSLNANILLDKFTQWGPSGFQNSHDIGQFWTSQNMYYLQDQNQGDIESNRGYGVAGLAWVNALCGNNRYHILEEYTSTDWPLRVLVAHEMGHNFGAGHDNASGNIMAGSISINTNTWSSESKTSINNALSGFECLEECITGSCSQISNVISSGCKEGSPSTYNLSLTIEHAGGGTSTGFTVNVDGQSYSHDWGNSPQSITIENLVADGSEGNTVSITANDGSDTGCGGSAVYDVPDASCALYETEDFNNCSLPLGWEAFTDNNVTINNGDPLLQYAWKFDDSNRYLVNYGAGNNVSTSKTIDGTCMALMDDDINSATYFQGIVTLNSPTYNTLGYSDVFVKFDYNFHPFEDGKSANTSYFKVNVWDGSQYINILTDTDGTCPWSNVWQSTCINSEAIDISQYSNTNLHIQFVYSDGKNDTWTGMVAMDNFEISGGSNFVSAPCPSVLTFTGANEEGVYEAGSMIQTSGDISINSNIQLDAPITEINQGFEVLQGAEITIMSDGCDNTTN